MALSQALQQAVQPVCKVLIQGQVNALGVRPSPQFNAVTRVDDFCLYPAAKYCHRHCHLTLPRTAAPTKRERIRPGFRVGIRLELCYWLLVGSLTWLLRAPVVSLFVAGRGAAEIVTLGSQYLGYMALFYALPALTNAFQGFYRGMGKMTTTLIGTCLQAGLRAPRSCSTPPPPPLSFQLILRF